MATGTVDSFQNWITLDKILVRRDVLSNRGSVSLLTWTSVPETAPRPFLWEGSVFYPVSCLTGTFSYSWLEAILECFRFYYVYQSVAFVFLF
jgi:hypothetical protein